MDSLPKGTVSKRDAALLTIGFASGMRRSELVALDYEDITRVPEGLRVMIRMSKTDQERIGRLVAIPYGRTDAGTREPIRAARSSGIIWF